NDTTIVTLVNGIMLDNMESGDSLNASGWLWYVTGDSSIGGNSFFTNFEKDSIGHYKIIPAQGAGYDSSSGFRIDYSMGDKANCWGGHSVRAGIILTGGNTVDMSVNKKLSFWAKSSTENTFIVQIRTQNDTCDDDAYKQIIEISPEWNEYTIDVTGNDFSCPMWVSEHSFDAEKVVGISWYIEGSSNATGWLAVDNIYLHE
ncbi:MAG TPA: hypothetical protein VHO68_13270, partial [Bacteroidales bacterium]|nr:hypothetical protein [Bacteroidales bacterium]